MINTKVNEFAAYLGGIFKTISDNVSETQGLVADAQAAVNEAQAAVASSVPAFDTIAELALTEVNSNYVLIAGAVFKQSPTGPAVDSAGTYFSPLTINPLMFGAVGDGSTNDLAALQACWDFAGANGIPVDLLGKEYNCNESLHTSSNLTVYGNGATLYITEWPAVGGFVNNVILGDPVARVQKYIHLEGITFDGSKLPAPVGQNTNLLGFARGAEYVRVIDCVGRNMRDGAGGGTGGGAFGVEQGGENIEFINCTAEDCYRGFRVAGIDGTFTDAGAQSKRAVNIRVTNFTARRCGTAVFAHSVGHDGDDQSDLSVFDCVIDGLYIEDCGHYAWREHVATASIPAQKTGAINLAGAQNVRFRGVRIKLNSGFPQLFTDWQGNTGYPASGDYIGAGLSGPIGALVWGWGRNVVFEDITVDGSFDVIWKCARAITFGDLASVSPTDGVDGTVSQVVFESVRHVRPGVWQYAFDGQDGLDNGDMSCRIGIEPSSNPALGVVGPNGTAGLTNVFIKFTSNTGATQEGSVKQWWDYGNTRPSAAAVERHFQLGGQTIQGPVEFGDTLEVAGDFDLGGGYSSVGSSLGASYDVSSGIRRSSQDASTAKYHLAFYNPNGLVGGIRSNASATEFLTSSDARLKENFRDFDALSIVNAIDPKEYDWVCGGSQHGLIAQELYKVFPNAVSVGDTDEEWESKTTGDRIPWEVDYSKLVPVLLQAVKELSEKLDK